MDMLDRPEQVPLPTFLSQLTYFIIKYMGYFFSTFYKNNLSKRVYDAWGLDKKRINCISRDVSWSLRISYFASASVIENNQEA